MSPSTCLRAATTSPCPVANRSLNDLRKLNTTSSLWVEALLDVGSRWTQLLEVGKKISLESVEEDKNIFAFAGLKTALVEKFDYSSGTSSRSTKLIHGGVRYLQKAIMGLDKEQVHWNLFTIPV